jgi:hypothetical protein
MIPEGFEPLSFEDRILVARVNLCCAAIALLLPAFCLVSSDLPFGMLPILGAAGLIYLSSQLEALSRRLSGSSEPGNSGDVLTIHYLFPF